MQTTKCPTSWTPPPPTSYKINVDGAIFVANKSVGVGILIRDEYGRLVGADSKKLRLRLVQCKSNFECKMNARES